MLRIAFCSPLPPAATGIADYSASLLPQLNQRADLTLFVDDPDHLPVGWSYQYRMLPRSTFADQFINFDMVVYQMGNSLHHKWIYDYAVRYSGVVVLHDYGMHHFVAARTAGEQYFGGYVREMGYSAGVDGIEAAWRIGQGTRDHDLLGMPLNERLIDVSHGMVVHSATAKQRVLAVRPNAAVEMIPAVMDPDQDTNLADAAGLRQRLGLRPDDILFVCAGDVTPAKQVNFVIQAFAQLRESLSNVYLAIVGKVRAGVDLQTDISRLGLESAVTVLGRAPSISEFNGWVAAANVLVNLRHPTVGETSAVVLRGLAAGVPVVVFDTDWYSELSDEVAARVPSMDLDQLVAAMKELATDSVRRAQMGQAGRTLVATEHAPAIVAQHYVDFCGRLVSGIMGSSKGPIDSG